LLERAHAARNGHRFGQLWAGCSEGYTSESEADMALCGMLAYWAAGDGAQVERLFRRSGLYREVKGEGYLQLTVRKAL
jgi:primase-polymerase (primpol)-like protein